jgi:hypothetical protein
MENKGFGFAEACSATADSQHGATYALHDLIQALLNVIKPLPNNFDPGRQLELAALHQTRESRWRLHFTLRAENLSTIDDGRVDSLGYLNVRSSHDSRVELRPSRIERSKDSELARRGLDWVQDGVDAGAIGGRCLDRGRVLQSRPLEARCSTQ